MNRPMDAQHRRARRTLHLFAALFLLAPAALPAATFSLESGLPIQVREVDGLARVAEPVTFGFPLREEDGVRSTAELAVLDPTGAAVPAQFRVTERWHGGPGNPNRPIRWLIVDLQVDVPAGQEVVYRLTRAAAVPQAEAAPPLAFERAAGGDLVVATGAAEFVLDGRTMSLPRRVSIDLDGDGVVTSRESVIEAARDSGFQLTDRFGATYSSNQSPVAWTVEESGPLRLVLRADGLHAPTDPTQGIGRDFFQYRTRLTFHAGKPYVRVQHTLRNAYLDAPLGTMGFEGYELRTRLRKGFGGKRLRATFGLDDGAERTLRGHARLRQDGDGGEQWTKDPLASFRGFQVTSGRRDRVVGAGNRAAGWFEVGTDDAGLLVVMRHFFENYPKAFTHDGRRGVRFELFPADTQSFFWLDDGQQKTTDFLLCARGPGGPARADVVTSFTRRLLPFPDPEWTRQSRAWGDQGHLDRPNAGVIALRAYDDAQLVRIYDDAATRSSYAFGWSEFGEPIWCRNTHTTGSPRNKLTYFDKFAMSGSVGGFRVAEAFALHSRDLRTYHIDGFRKEDHPQATLWEGFPVWPYSKEKLGRDVLDPALAPHRAGIPYQGHGWNGCDFEHLVADDLYEHWLMTGDLVTLDSLRELGELMRTWPIYDPVKAPGSTRGTGWTLRALVKVYQVTGDPAFLESADALVRSVANTYGQHPSTQTNLVYRFVTRYPPHPNHIATAEYDLPWQLAVVIHGMMLHHRETRSRLSRQIAIDIADYLVDYGWSGQTMHEALSVHDHTVVRPSASNMGINTWIPAALTLVYRTNPRPELLFAAKTMYDSVPGVTNPLTYNGYGIHHWWHSYRSLLLGDP